jgi:hypothetical protein
MVWIPLPEDLNRAFSSDNVNKAFRSIIKNVVAVADGWKTRFDTARNGI